jgi:predicted phage terminase large subunit-like protein
LIDVDRFKLLGTYRTPRVRFGAVLDRNAAIKATAHADKRRQGVRVVSTWIEQEPGASGISDAQAIIRDLAGFYVQAWKESGDKDVRIRPFAGQWQSRNVLIVEGAWNAAYLAQMKTIPGAKRRDMADASAGAFNRLTERGGAASLPGLPNKGQGTLVSVPDDVYR